MNASGRGTRDARGGDAGDAGGARGRGERAGGREGARGDARDAGDAGTRAIRGDGHRAVGGGMTRKRRREDEPDVNDMFAAAANEMQASERLERDIPESMTVRKSAPRTAAAFDGADEDDDEGDNTVGEPLSMSRAIRRRSSRASPRRWRWGRRTRWRASRAMAAGGAAAALLVIKVLEALAKEGDQTPAEFQASLKKDIKPLMEKLPKDFDAEALTKKASETGAKLFERAQSVTDSFDEVFGGLNFGGDADDEAEAAASKLLEIRRADEKAALEAQAAEDAAASFAEAEAKAKAEAEAKAKAKPTPRRPRSQGEGRSRSREGREAKAKAEAEAKAKAEAEAAKAAKPRRRLMRSQGEGRSRRRRLKPRRRLMPKPRRRPKPKPRRRAAKAKADAEAKAEGRSRS